MVINSGQQHSTVNSFVETTECSLLFQTIRIDTKLLSNHLPPGSIQFALDHCQESSERKKIQLSSEITCVHWRALTIYSSGLSTQLWFVSNVAASPSFSSWSDSERISCFYPQSVFVLSSCGASPILQRENGIASYYKLQIETNL